MLSNLPLCLVQHIFNYLDFKTQIRFLKTCKTYNKLYIHELTDIHYCLKLTDLILKQKKFEKISALNISCNNKITHISYLKYLKNLKYVGDLSIKFPNKIYDLHLLDLNVLDISYNNVVTDISHMHNLKKLICNHGNNLPHLGNIKLKELILNNFKSKINIGDQTDLKILYGISAYKICGINNLINLTELHIPGMYANEDIIINLKYLTKLNILDCSGNIKIKGIKHVNLYKLVADNNTYIKPINHMTNLRILQCKGKCSIYDLSGLDLIELNAAGNHKIIEVNHLKNLLILDCSYDCGIYNVDKLNLFKLCAGYNPRICNINHMTNLRVLDCMGNCGIYDITGLNLIICISYFNDKFKKK